MPKTQGVGPWDGGLNFSSNRDLSQYLNSNELGTAVNVQLTSEGFVESRPGFRTLDVGFNTGAPEIRILGSLNIAGEIVSVVQVRTTDTKIYYVRGNKTAILKATMTLANDFSSTLALRNSESPIGPEVPRGVFLFSRVAVDACYRLEEVPNLTTAVTPTLMSSILKVPASDFSFSVKDRVFLVTKSSSQIWWSALLEQCLFFNQDEVTSDVPPISTARAKETGDEKLEPSIDQSDNITSVEFVNNNFYLFKKSSAFLFTYQADPENDGYLRKFNEEIGAFDSTLFRNTVVVINNRGVFTVEGTEFIDIQQKLNLRFETPIDNRSAIEGFVSVQNSLLLVGFRSSISEQEYHYVLNGYNRGWTQWDFSYGEDPDVIASPGSNGYLCQEDTGLGVIIYTTFDKKRLVYSDWKPSRTNYEYTLDGTRVRDAESAQLIRYIPRIDIGTKTLVGDSQLDFKKLLRTYVRLYISDLDYTITNTYWNFSINYNNYYFISTNPKYQLAIQEAKVQNPDQKETAQFAPRVSKTIDLIPMASTNVITEVYRRTYQIPLPMHRVKEFTFQLARDFTRLVDVLPKNDRPDRPIEGGYYFLLSGFWIDFNEKSRI